ncbi:hypothetical protein Acr_25g0003240 [Actinidia rufa]|uniref:Uncharacterized protein n=1 Tax=Actinidia rufa TaxID=165716 RepID=A0A7J0GYK6_9ERIC|nr:hypothetical protein Acr_25g0003240 [Actinidia rufa]
MDPPEKLTPPKFTLYDGKSNLRSHFTRIRQMMTLWNYLDALMYRVFPSSLGDLGLTWFDSLPTGSIEGFYQLIESFIARVSNSQLQAQADWEDLTLSPPFDLQDLMSQVKMFGQLKDDVRKEERATRTTPRAKDQFKKRKKGSANHESRVRQVITMVLKEPIYKLLALIRHKPYFKKPDPMGWDI